MGTQDSTDTAAAGSVISLPKGGGAIAGLGEAFAPDLFTGTGNTTVPITTPAGRGGLQPQLALTYSTGAGNGPFGLGWQLGVAGVARKTSRGVPRYLDGPGAPADIFLLPGAEDLVPVAGSYPGRVRYQPRTEGLFARIEHVKDATQDVWEVRTKDGHRTRYGTVRPAGAAADWRDPAVVADPANPQHIFAWRVTESADPLGNAIRYTYVADQGDTPEHRWNQPLLSRVSYVDYGDPANPSFLVTVDLVYSPRPDPFSEYRSGFEIRTTQRCDIIRVTTHAADGVDRVAREYRLSYTQAAFTGASLLAGVTVVGVDQTQTQSMPPLTFEYAEFSPAGRRFELLTGPALPTTPLTSPTLALVDLHGAGLPDIVELSSTAQRYWRNAGNGRFELPRNLGNVPPFVLGADGVRLLDADGDGRADLFVASTPVAGFFPMTNAGGWSQRSFRSYPQLPSVNLADASVKLIDLDGDGLTDVLQSGTGLRAWFNDVDPAQAWLRTAASNGDGPQVDLADPRVRLADMTGDGLSDIVLLHSGSISYWPNLGHGRWGPKVVMRTAPRLPDGYDPRRVLLGDVDGDGAADLVYVDHGRVLLWGNQSGNAWTAQPVVVQGTLAVTDVDAIQLADLHGSGMAGVLYSRASDGAAYFLDFTGALKPYLLTTMDNHLGARTTVHYGSSTKEYLRDAASAATHWRTTLPFPVHVVSQVDVQDEISGGRVTSQFRYHHGYWDGVEREFRGFAMVERQDAENFVTATVVPQQFSPPTLTRTWFHVGPVAAVEAGDWTELDLSNEFWPDDPSMLARPDLNAAVPGLSRTDRRSALRALRGHVLRTELYALDGTDRQARPFSVSEAVVTVRQESPPPAGVTRTRIFFPFTISSRSTQWERGVEPMTRFTFAGPYDAYGISTTHLDVAVPRGRDPRQPIPAAGQPYLAGYGVVEMARRDDADHYLVDRVARTFDYEVVNDGRLAVADLAAAVPAGAAVLPEAAVPASGVALRLMGHHRTFYDGPEFVGLPLGQLGEHGLPVRVETLAFTDAFLSGLFDAAPPAYLDPTNPPLPASYPPEFRDRLPRLAGYQHYTDADVAGSPGGYYAATAQHRFDVHVPGMAARGRPVASRDPLGALTEVSYDQHDFLPVLTVDAVGLRTTATYDYRVLQARDLTDANGNTHSVVFAPAGMVTAQFVRGRNGEGDQAQPSTTFTYDLLAFAQRHEPTSVRTTRRTHHDADVDVPADVRDDVLVSVEYSDGFGRVLQARTQAEDTLFGDASFGGGVIDAADLSPVGDAVGRTRTPGDPDNVVVSVLQVYDNKGRVVQRYEPFYATGYDYVAPSDAQLGQKVTLFYDPRGQVIRTLDPEGSEVRVIFGVPGDLANPDSYAPTPWEAYTYDANDNAGRTHPDAASAYRNHWNTPASVVLDALSRPAVSVARNGAADADQITTLSAYDLRGNLISVTDPLGRQAFTYQYDLADRRWRVDGIDTGRHDNVLDAIGNTVESRDSKGALSLTAFDPLHRATHLWARDDAGGDVTLRHLIEYGDGGSADQSATDRADATARNLLGRMVRQHDEAGLVTVTADDFKGNRLETTRQVVADAPILATYAAASMSGWQITPLRIDWTPASGQTQAARDAELIEPAGYTTTTTYDALNRIVSHRLPSTVDGHRPELRPTYNRAGVVESVSLDGTTYVQRLAYNAKGQRILAALGNGVMTRYAYDPRTFRLARARSEQYLNQGLTYQPTGAAIEDRGFDYDLTGNILTIRERAPGSGIPNNPDGLSATDPVLRTLLGRGDALDRRFSYDPTYRLLTATGREAQVPRGDPFIDVPRGVDPTQTQSYQESYGYDPAGSLVSLAHASNGGFTRALSSTAGTNRLQRMTIADRSYDYTSDPCGNLLSETTSRHFSWGHADRLIAFGTQVAGSEPSVHAQYLYDASGRRVKKLVRRQGGLIEVAHYLDEVFEHHRWTVTGSSGQNNHVHVLGDNGRVALARLGPAHPADQGPAVAYHLSDHLGSSTVVVDDKGTVTNREEYTPYGETSFGSFTRKRYRFTGRERDEESGLALHGQRYYAPWLARWTATDPAARAGGLHQYAYCAGNPLSHVDLAGASPKEISEGDLRAAVRAEAQAHRDMEGIDRALEKLSNLEGERSRQWAKHPEAATPDLDRKIQALEQRIEALQANVVKAADALKRALSAFSETHGSKRALEVVHDEEGNILSRRIDEATRNAGKKGGSGNKGGSGKGSKSGPAQRTQGSRVNRGGGKVIAGAGKALAGAATVVGVYALAGGTVSALKATGEDIKEGHFGSAALNASGYLGGAFTLGGLAASSSGLLTAGRVLGAPGAVAGSFIIGTRIGTNLYDNYVDKDQTFSAGQWVEHKLHSRIAGAVAAAGVAIGSAAYHAPEAAVDYAKETWTVNPNEIDWGKTVSPWRWF
jgi:RHS repeat-associated protein